MIRLPFFIILFLTLLLVSCDMFQTNIVDYLEYYTNTAGIEKIEFDANYPIDPSGVVNISSDSEKTITFTLRNPQNYTLIPTISFDDTSISDGYTIEQSASNKSIITLTFDDLGILQGWDSAGGKDISGTISLEEPDSGRFFDEYSFEAFVNSKPIAVINAQFAKTASPDAWWIYFNAPEKTGTQTDIVGISINGTYYDYDDSHFQTSAPSELKDLFDADFIPSGNNQRYLNTGFASNANLTRTITVIDSRGLTSPTVTIKTGDIPKVSQPTISSAVKNAAAGVYTITLESSMPDTILYYTTDGSEPATSAVGETKLYDKANKFDITIARESVTVKAIATKTSMSPSDVAEQTFSLERHMLNFDANNGSGSMESQEFVHGIPQAINKNTFTRSGYTFDGWNTQADNNGNPYADEAEYTATANGTLYAQWSANTEVYLNSDSVAVSGDGTVDNPFSNFAAAKAALPEGGTIFVKATINPQEGAVWRSDSGKPITIKPYGVTGFVISVTNANFTLENITVDGDGERRVEGLITTDTISSNNLTLGEGVVVQNGSTGAIKIGDGDTLTLSGNIQVHEDNGYDISYVSTTESPIRIAGALDGAIVIEPHSTEVGTIIATSANSYDIDNDDLKVLHIGPLDNRITITDGSEVTIAPLISNASITMNEPSISNTTVNGTWSISDGSFDGDALSSTIILETGEDLTNEQIASALRGAINVSNADVNITPSDANDAALGQKTFTVRLTANENYVFEDRTTIKNIVITFSLKELIAQNLAFSTTAIETAPDRAGLSSFNFNLSSISSIPTVSFDYNDITQSDRQAAILKGLTEAIQGIPLSEGLAAITPTISSAPNSTIAYIEIVLSTEAYYVFNRDGHNNTALQLTINRAFIPDRADYYVSTTDSPNDTNLGIADTVPFASVQRAVDVINAYNRTAETTIHIIGNIVEQGGYEGNGGSADSMIVIDGGSSTRNIILQGYNGNASIDAGAQFYLDDGTITEPGLGKRVLYIAGANTTVTLGSSLTLAGGSNVTQGSGVNINGGHFILDGGQISQNLSQSNGAVFINAGRFTMDSGKISENRANNYSGGGVYVKDGTIFTMNGGEIYNNKIATTEGGGVSVRGTFIMTGGEIHGNTEGGGVYIFGGNDSGLIQLKGKPIIRNNSDGGTTRNLAFINSNDSTYVEISEELTAEAVIGLTPSSETKDFVVARWTGTGNMPDNTASRFSLDSGSVILDLEKSGNNIILGTP